MSHQSCCFKHGFIFKKSWKQLYVDVFWGLKNSDRNKTNKIFASSLTEFLEQFVGKKECICIFNKKCLGNF